MVRFAVRKTSAIAGLAVLTALALMPAGAFAADKSGSNGCGANLHVRVTSKTQGHTIHTIPSGVTVTGEWWPQTLTFRSSDAPFNGPSSWNVHVDAGGVLDNPNTTGACVL